MLFKTPAKEQAYRKLNNLCVQLDERIGDYVAELNWQDLVELAKYLGGFDELVADVELFGKHFEELED